jgi:hypothetical protein
MNLIDINVTYSTTYHTERMYLGVVFGRTDSHFTVITIIVIINGPKIHN